MSILTNTLFTILPIFIFVFYAIYTIALLEQCGYGIESLKDKGRALVFQDTKKDVRNRTSFFNNSSGKLEFHLQTPAWLRVRHIVPCFATDQARFHRYMEYQYE